MNLFVNKFEYFSVDKLSFFQKFSLELILTISSKRELRYTLASIVCPNFIIITTESYLYFIYIMLNHIIHFYTDNMIYLTLLRRKYDNN